MRCEGGVRGERGDHKNNTKIAAARSTIIPTDTYTHSEHIMPRARVRKVERKRKRSEVKTEPLADGAGASSSAAGAGRAGARGGGGSVSGRRGASHCGPPPAKRARVTVKKERKVKVKKEKGKGKVEVKSEEKEGGEEEMAFDLAPPRRRGGETEEPLGPPRYGKRGKTKWDGVSRWMHFSS